MSHAAIAIVTPMDVQARSWNGMSAASPVVTMTMRAAMPARIPIEPSSSHAGKYAPNSTNDGAPCVVQPPSEPERSIVATLRCFTGQVLAGRRATYCPQFTCL